MKIIKHSFKIILPMLFLLMAISVNAQNARLNFDRLNGLEAKATDVVEVTIDGKMLALAKRVMTKVNDKDAKKIGEAIKGLEGIYVRVYNFDQENQYSLTDIDEIRSQLNQPGWERLANVRSKKNAQKVDVFTMFTGDVMSGLAVVVSEAKSIAVINVIGPIDIYTLVELSGSMNIPKLDLGREKEEKPKP
jgi:Domain of unknown function (DUF4252)